MRYVIQQQGSKWDGIRRYGIPALLWSAWNHTATSFWPTPIPVCRRPLNSCKSYCPDPFRRRKICQKCVCGRGSVPDLEGELTAPLAGFKGPTSKGRGGHPRKQRWWEGDGEEGEGKGHTGTSSSPFRALFNSLLRTAINCHKRHTLLVNSMCTTSQVMDSRAQWCNK